MTFVQLCAFVSIALAPLGLRSMIRLNRDPDQVAVAEHRRRMELLAPEDDR